MTRPGQKKKKKKKKEEEEGIDYTGRQLERLARDRDAQIAHAGGQFIL